MQEFIYTEIYDLNALIQIFESLGEDWIFRGHASFDWDLTPTIERWTKQFKAFPEYVERFENKIVEEFKRASNNFLKSEKRWNSEPELIAYMQHYGAPTRLLDFTSSIFIAAYFACQQLTNSSCIWGINLTSLRRNLRMKYNIDPSENLVFSDFDKEVLVKLTGYNDKQDLVVAYRPNAFHERLTYQKGLFLLPSRIDRSFMELLGKTFSVNIKDFANPNNYLTCSSEKFPSSLDDYSIIKLRISGKDIQATIIEYLRSHNISSTVLFPGLDGFSNDLKWFINDLMKMDRTTKKGEGTHGSQLSTTFRKIQIFQVFFIILVEFRVGWHIDVHRNLLFE